jgi:hypothetical protein
MASVTADLGGNTTILAVFEPLPRGTADLANRKWCSTPSQDVSSLSAVNGRKALVDLNALSREAFNG